MHPVVAHYMSALAEFRSWLDASNLAEVLALYEPYAEEERELVIRRDLTFLPDHLAVVTRFFVLGDNVPEEQLNLHLPGSVRETLTAVGLDLTRHRLIRHLDLWVICDRLNPAVDLYHGDDSIGLSRLMLPGRGRCLDLCAGVGTQGLLCAQTAQSLVAVEKQEKAQLFFWLNAVLNGLEAKVEFRQGDFVEAIAGERFDHIVCNPPLLPVPREVEYPLVGDGGPDGLDFPRRLLAALPALLNPGGRCHMIGTLLGGPLGPDLSEWEHSSKTSGLDLLAILPFRASLAPGAPVLNSLVASAVLFADRRGTPEHSGDNARTTRDRAEQAYRLCLTETGATHLYSFFLSATNTGAPGGSFHCTRHFMDTRRMWSR